MEKEKDENLTLPRGRFIRSIATEPWHRFSGMSLE
jgi:hypothetical protein